jgi:uncharacterized protein with PQ loop repeat
MLEHKELDRLIPLFALLAQMDAVYAPASSTYSTAFPVSPAFTGHAGTRPIRSLVPSKERAQIPIQSIHCCYLCLCCWLNKINWRFLKTKNEVKVNPVINYICNYALISLCIITYIIHNRQRPSYCY